MLIVSRRANEVIEIRPHADSSDAKLKDVFAGGAIEISLVELGRTRVRVAIDAPPELKIRRRAGGHEE